MPKIRNVTLKNQQIWYDAELLSQPVESCFDPEYWQNRSKVTGSAQGRGTTWFVQLDDCEGALRHYCRGGLFGKLIRDSYWFTDWEKTRSYAEFHLLNHLRQQGVNVPRPIAATAIRQVVGYKADILVEKIPQASDLVDILQKEALSSAVYLSIGKMIRTLHDAQVNHTDLNIHNILLDSQQKVWLIDFDKCYTQLGDSWKEGNLNRLLRSFRKEVLRFNIQWQESDWQMIAKGYSLINKVYI